MRAHATTVVSVFLLPMALACSHQEKPVVSPRILAARPTPMASTQRDVSKQDASVRRSKNESPKEDPPAIFFDFDSVQLRDDAFPVLEEAARSIRRHGLRLRVEGNCDELGTVEYNLALGEQRARAAKDYLVYLGVPPDRVRTISFGSEHPKYLGVHDDALAKNRRDDFMVIR